MFGGMKLRCSFADGSLPFALHRANDAVVADLASASTRLRSGNISIVLT
jgi:hypothetical protein